MKKKCKVVQIKYPGHPHDYSHLYIISDDEVKVGDYVYSIRARKVGRFGQFENSYTNECRKVIASTDPSLDLPAIPEWFIQEYAEKQTSEVLVEYHSSSNIFVIPHDDKMDQSEIVLHRVKETWTRDEIESAMESVLSEYTCTLSFLKNELLKRLDSVEQD